MNAWTIGQLAKNAGVSVDTVRHYERIGLLPRLGPSGGWRRYPDEMLTRLRYLRDGRAVGFSLRELRELMKLTISGRPRFCEAFDAAVGAKIEAIDGALARLSAQRLRLEEYSRGCRQRRLEGRCPILENLKISNRNGRR
jgi:MerR family mercuric resistance operon transcriptional regulator